MSSSDILTPLLISALAGISTLIGGIAGLFFKQISKKFIAFILGFSAGVMIYISFVELLGQAVIGIGFWKANIFFFIGAFSIALIDFILPHEYIEEKMTTTGLEGKQKKVFSAGILVATGIAIHNFPEGMAVFATAYNDIHLGLAVAFAIAIHNIPEGFVVYFPIYYSTGSKKKALILTALSGIAEPVGAGLCALVLFPIMTPVILNMLLATVGGLMVFISFDELLPLSFNEDQGHLSITGIFLGMGLMAFSLGIF